MVSRGPFYCNLKANTRDGSASPHTFDRESACLVYSQYMETNSVKVNVPLPDNK